MTLTLRVGEPQELLALVPFRLGFHPRSSAVLVSLRGDRGQVGLVARADLADLSGRSDRAGPERHGEQADGDVLAAVLVRRALADGARRLVLVLYPDEDVPRARDQTSPAWRAADAVTRALSAQRGDPGCPSVETWVVTRTGYGMLGCLDAACCPDGGRPLQDLLATRVSAHMVLSGVTVAPSREDLARLDPAPAEARGLAAAAAESWRRAAPAPGEPTSVAAALADQRHHAVVARRREGLAAWRSGLDGDRHPEVLGVIAAALDDTVVRDAVLLTSVPGAGALPDALVEGRSSTRGCAGATDLAVSRAVASIVDPGAAVRPEADVSDAARDLLEAVVRHGQPAQAPARTLLALLAWWSGDGARAAAHVDAALAADPGYRLARLLDRALGAGLGPGWTGRGERLATGPGASG